MEPALADPLRFTYFNDSVRVAFRLPTTGLATYSLKAQLASTGATIAGSPALINRVVILDSRKTVVSGLGLCSGLQGQSVSFDIMVKDQLGAAFTEDVTLTVSRHTIRDLTLWCFRRAFS